MGILRRIRGTESQLLDNSRSGNRSTSTSYLHPLPIDMADEAELEKIAEATGLDLNQMESLQKAFDNFAKNGENPDEKVSLDSLGMVFKMLGLQVNKQAILEVMEEMDCAETRLDFALFCSVASKFMTGEDEEQMREELKEAFRIYDRDGMGYITTDVLKEILKEIAPSLTNEQLDGIIEEVDEDGSGTLDFDEFQEMMMG